MRTMIKFNAIHSAVKQSKQLLSPLALAMLAVGILSINGCATNKNSEAPLIMASTQDATSADADQSVRPEFIYRYLVGEVSGQRGDLGTSGAIFYDLAKNERDARLAERAAKIAAYGNISNLAAPAIKLWAELDPDSSEAQQAMTEMLIATGKLEDTKPYLAKLLEKEETRANGFLYLNTLLARNQDKAAVATLIESLAAPYPTLAEAQFAVAQAAWSANKDDTALNAITKTEQLRPGWDIAALLKGQILFTKSPQAAIDYYDQFLKSHSDANEVRINLAKLLVSQKQYAAAQKEFPTIIQQAKNSPNKNVADVTAIVGLLSFQAGDYTSAQNYFQEALLSGFKDVDQIHLYLGQTAERLNQDKSALDWYKKVPLGPRHLEAQISIAQVIARTESPQKAIDFLDELENLNTEQQIMVIKTQAAILSKAKQNKEAFDLLDAAVKNLPNTPELVYDYALAAERLQKFDLMETELRKAIAFKPDFAAAYNALGYSFADRNVKVDEAISLIQKALELSPNDHYMLDSLGWAYYRKGNLDQAINYLQQAYSINPDPEIAAHLGEVLWHKGRHDQAKKIWTDALSMDPDNEVLLATANKFKS